MNIDIHSKKFSLMMNFLVMQHIFPPSSIHIDHWALIHARTRICLQRRTYLFTLFSLRQTTFHAIVSNKSKLQSWCYIPTVTHTTTFLTFQSNQWTNYYYHYGVHLEISQLILWKTEIIIMIYYDRDLNWVTLSDRLQIQPSLLLRPFIENVDWIRS